jgi:hypothetical protein
LIGIGPLELADADLGPLQVGHDAYGTARLVRGGPQRVDPLAVVIRRAMGKVDAHHVDPGRDQGQHALGTA